MRNFLDQIAEELEVRGSADLASELDAFSLDVADNQINTDDVMTANNKHKFYSRNVPENSDVVKDGKKLLAELGKVVGKDDLLYVKAEKHLGPTPHVYVAWHAAPFANNIPENAKVMYKLFVQGYDAEGNREAKGELDKALIRPRGILRNKKGGHDQIFRYLVAATKKAQALRDD